MWKIPQARLSCFIRSTHDTLPSPSNLCLWYGSEESCQLCNAPNPSLQHILPSCKTALTQGRYRWCHDRVLRRLEEILEVCRAETAREPLALTSGWPIYFVREGGGASNITQPQRSALAGSCEWNLRVDLDRQLRFPTGITTTNLRPDIILWSATARAVILQSSLSCGREEWRQPLRVKKAGISTSQPNAERLGGQLSATQWKSAVGGSWEHPPSAS
ncbi:uncharacterized protein LOC120575395 [Perca fluviatilis]|uniref:uncharacterized protein LOC120575395 n=1 Tax=Perca fluviatilis TaxID=8168 RepID=UPI0019658CEB|nr:uncharacterized protein LOC120575395 [Perca fluviatilis]